MLNIDILFNGKANFSGVQSQLEKVRKEWRQLGQTMDQVASKSGSATLSKDQIDQLQKIRRDTNAMLDATRGLYIEQKNIVSSSKQFSAELEKHKVKFTDIARNMATVKQAYKEQLAMRDMLVTSWRRSASGKLDMDIMVPRRANADMDTFINRLGYASHLAKSGAEQMINWGKNTQWAGRQLMVGFTMPTLMASAAVGRMGYELDTALTKIIKVYGDVSQASTETTATIRKNALETAQVAAKAFGQDFQDTLEIQAQLAATGKTGSELQSDTMQVSRAKLLGELNVQSAMKATIALQSIYKMSSQELGDAINYMNMMENQTVLTMDDMIEGIPRVSGLMETLGASLQETGVYLAAFKAAGVDIAEGATALKSISFKAIAPTPTAEKNFLGITGKSLKGIVAETKGELLPTLKAISKEMDGLSQAGKVDLVARVFGIHQGSKALQLLDQLKDLDDATTQVGRAWQIANSDASTWAATAQQELLKLQQSTSGQANRILAEAKTNLAEIGMTALEAAIPILKTLGGFVEWFNNLGDGSKKFLMMSAILIGIIGPITMLVGLFANLIGTFIKVGAGIVGLVTRFKLLNENSVAAKLAQEMMNVEFAKGQDYADKYARAISILGGQIGYLNSMVGASRKSTTSASTALGQSTNAHRVNAAAIRAEAQAQAQLNAQTNAYIGRHRASSSGVNGKMAGIATGAATTSMFTSGTVGDIANGVFGVAMVASMIKSGGRLESIAKKVATGMGNAFSTVGTKISGIAGKAAPAFSKIAALAAGPVGMGILGGVTAVLLIMNKINDDAEEAERKYQALANSANSWAEAFGLQKGATKKPDLAANEVNRMDAELSAIKEKSADLFDTLAKYQAPGVTLGEKWGVAISEGLKVSFDGYGKAAAESVVRSSLAAMGAVWSDAEWEKVFSAKNIDFASSSNVGAVVSNFNDFMDQVNAGVTAGKDSWFSNLTDGMVMERNEVTMLKSKILTSWKQISKLNAEQRKEALDAVYKPLFDKVRKEVEGWGEMTDAQIADTIGALPSVANKNAEAIRIMNVMFRDSANLSKDVSWSYEDLRKRLEGTSAAADDGADHFTRMNNAVQASIPVAKAAAWAWSDFDEKLQGFGVSQQNVIQGMQGVMADANNIAFSAADDLYNRAMDSSMRALEKKYQRQQDALDAQADALRAKSQKQAKDLNALQRQETKDLKAQQDAREKAVSDYWDSQINGIQALIDAEQTAEEQRQKIFDAEQTRLQRMSSLLNKQIEYRQALASGNTDQAVILQTDISSMQNQWNSQDSATSAAAISEERKAQLELQKKQLEDAKAAAIDNLKTIDEAEQDALAAKQDRANEELQIVQDLEQKKLDAKKKALDEQSRNAQDAAKRQQEFNKRSLDAQLEALKNFVPRNQAELNAHIKKIEAAYASHGIQVNIMGSAWGKILNESISNGTMASLATIRSQAAWSDAGAEIAQKMIQGVFPGIDINQFVAWLLDPTQAVPSSFLAMAKNAKKMSSFDKKYGGSTILHTGGIAGVTRGGTAGMAGSPKEYNATLLHGEGVLNLNAMQKPGMKDFVEKANAGKLGQGGESTGVAGIMAASMAGLMRQAITASILNAVMRKQTQSFGQVGDPGKYGGSTFSAEQLKNASTIIGVGKSMGASQRDLIGALMAAMQESTLRNLSGGDRDSLGLFQQRPSQGWGTPADIMNPTYASKKFYEALFKVKDRDKMPLTLMIQAVQRSAYPYAYAKWQDEAEAILGSAFSYGGGSTSSGGWTMPVNGVVTSRYGMRVHPITGVKRLHDGTDIAAPTGTPIRAARGGTVAFAGSSGGLGNYVLVSHGGGIATGYAHQSKIGVSAGQFIGQGQTLGYVGSTGLSTGPHLHFQYKKDGVSLNPNLIIPGLATGAWAMSDGIAKLHQGEIVVPKPLSRELVDGIGNRGGDEYKIHIVVENANSQIDFQRGVEDAILNINRRTGKK